MTGRGGGCRRSSISRTRFLPASGLLFVTMHASTAYVKAAFEAGGTGYVLKSGLRDELPDAVQSVLGGRTLVSPGLSKEYRKRVQGHTPAPRSSSQRTRARRRVSSLRWGIHPRKRIACANAIRSEEYSENAPGRRCRQSRASRSSASLTGFGNLIQSPNHE